MALSSHVSLGVFHHFIINFFYISPNFGYILETLYIGQCGQEGGSLGKKGAGGGSREDEIAK